LVLKGFFESKIAMAEDIAAEVGEVELGVTAGLL
jgi:hypothetical protein